MNAGARLLAIPDLMRRLSGHLDSLAAEVHEIEQVVANEFSKRSTFESSQIKRLQRLDFLRQSLEDMALLNHFLADHVLGETPKSLEARLRLETTKALLRPQQHRLKQALQSGDQGNVDLF